MKGILFRIISLGCFILSLCACSDNEESKQAMETDVVRLSVSLPNAFVAENGNNAFPAGSKLRYIVELRKQGNGSGDVQRLEFVQDAWQEQTVFDLSLSGGNYELLMWADYVDAGATEVEGRYADHFYNTSDLRNVSVKNVLDLVNNPAADAFYYHGEIQKAHNAGVAVEVTMKRPFTQICVREKSLKEFKLLKALKVAYKVPANFDVGMGKPTEEELDITYGNTAFDATDSEDGTLFTGLVFADETEEKVLGEILLDITTSMETNNQYQVTIPAIIPLPQGKRVVVSAHMLTPTPDPLPEFDIEFDINVADWMETEQNITVDGPVTTEVKVGRFLLADGTVSEKWSDNPAVIGIVFSTSLGTYDNSDYGKDFSGKKIAGYAMALNNACSRGNISKKQFSLNQTLVEAWGTGDYNGFEYSKGALEAMKSNDPESVVYTGYMQWLVNNGIAQSVSNLSSWYIPSSTQLIDFLTKAIGDDYDKEFADAYYELIKHGGDKLTQSTNSRGVVNFLASSTSQENCITYVEVKKVGDEEQITAQVDNGKMESKQVTIRPVITIFE